LHVKYLRANRDLKVEIQGNCDERGSREYNLGLGNQRALAVKAALELLGIASDRISITSFGSEKPVALGHDESSWKQNRRADFVY
jgi:peptidoglycan-associated lipoprotein